MRIEIATPRDIRFVALHMRERDFEELRALSSFDDREDIADQMTATYGRQDDTYCVSHDGRPVCIAAAVEGWPNVITLLFFATDEFPAVVLPVTRFVRRELFPRYDEAGVHRIQAVAMDGYAEVDRWLRILGLEPETDPLPAYGKRGEAFVQYARIRDARASGA